MEFQHFFNQRTVVWAGIGSVLVGVAGCTGSSPSDSGSASPSNPDSLPHVVVTSGVLCDLTQQIAEDTIQLTCLLAEGQDPHIYAPTSSDRQAIEEADLLLYGGYGYEPSLIQMIDATNTPSPKIAVFEEAVPNPLFGDEHDHDHGAEDTHDHDQDEEHGHEEEEHSHAEETVSAGASDNQVADPHVWLDAENGIAIARIIESHLADLAPEHQDGYTQRVEAIATELENVDQWITAQVATVPANARKLVTAHNSFQYYADAYGFEVAGALSGISTEEKPSAARLTELIDIVKDSQVNAIFAETTTNPQLIETVAKSAGVDVAERSLFVEETGGEESEVETYQQMLAVNTCTIVNALGGQCDAELAPTAKP